MSATSKHNFKFAIGDIIKNKDGITLLVTGHIEQNDVTLPCYTVLYLEKAIDDKWSYKYIESNYKKAS
jgi:hypothetical protein